MGTSVPAVTPLQQIDDAWGNQVRAELDANDAIADRLVADSTTLTLAAAAGWNAGIQYRRVGAWVHVDLVALTRTGAAIATATNAVVGTMPVGYRPGLPVTFIYIGTTNRDAWYATVSNTGVITLMAVTCVTNSGFRGSITYPVALP